MASTITVKCSACDWFAHVPAEYDDGPSFLSAREAASRVLANHVCAGGIERADADYRGVTPADEVVKTVELGVASPADIRAWKREQAEQQRQLREMRARR